MEELISIVQSLEGNTTKEEIQEMISKVDMDGKGSVNFEEFLNVIGMRMKVNSGIVNLFVPEKGSEKNVCLLIIDCYK